MGFGAALAPVAVRGLELCSLEDKAPSGLGTEAEPPGAESNSLRVAVRATNLP